MTDMSTGPMVDCPVCNEPLLPGDETDCAGNPLKTYEVVTVVKTTDMSRHTVDGNANYILWCNQFRALGTPAGTNDAGDVVGYLWDNAWEAGKSLHFF